MGLIQLGTRGVKTRIGQTLDTNADGAVPLVRPFSLGDGVKVGINDSVQVEGDHLGDADESLKIKFFVGSDKLRQIDGGQVTHRGLLSRGILKHLCAQVAAANRSEVFLVGFFIACVLVQHVGGPCLYLRLKNL